MRAQGRTPGEGGHWLEPGTGQYVRARQTHRRGLHKDLRLKCKDQTLAVYPADRMPPPYPVAFPVVLKRREEMTADIAKYEFVAPEGRELPPFEAGAHIDVLLARSAGGRRDHAGALIPCAARV